MNIITLDTGTTNTRVTVWKDEVPLCQLFQAVGVRNTAISGSKTILENSVKKTIAEALQKAGLNLANINLIVASGMITSNVGLFELPHLPAPAGLADLASGMVESLLPALCSKPVWFIPGIRNQVENLGLHNIEAMDMMRGEEVEVMGLLDRLALKTRAVIALPGSHSKFVHLDAQQCITGCVTTLAGELLQVITQHTILSEALDGDFSKEMDIEMLLAGAASATNLGLGRACFMVRTLSQFTVYQRNARANFLLGAILGADLLTLRNSTAMRMNPDAQFVITGKSILREALAALVSNDDFFSGKVTVINQRQQENMAGYGAIAIARQRGLLRKES